MQWLSSNDVTKPKLFKTLSVDFLKLCNILLEKSDQHDQWNVLDLLTYNFGMKNNFQQGVIVPLTGQLLGYFATPTCWGGGGVKRPHVITRERMAAEKRVTRFSKAIDETIVKHPLNIQSEVTCQFYVRSKVKIGAFGLRAVETSKLSVLGQSLLQILLKKGKGTDWVNVWY